jgi:hypothetical protein
MFFQVFNHPAMAPSIDTSPITGSPDASTAQSQLASTSPACPPLWRKGAIIMLTPAEQALELAMSRLSLPPEQVSRKRTHEQIDAQEGGDTEPDKGTFATPQARSLAPLLSNVTAVTLRYATYKKLCAEQ